MTPARKTTKLLIAAALCLPLAVLAGAHALSSASLRHSPDLAVSVFPSNGLAEEKVAYGAFVDSVKAAVFGAAPDADTTLASQAEVMKAFAGGASDLQPFANGEAQAARDAMMLEPLLPKAHALIALSEANPNRRNEIVALASRLNRRELALQSLVLQQKASEGDYAASITTLDQLLRVHPERKTEFFPLLVNALVQPETSQAFAGLLRNDLPWRDAFLAFAVSDPRALGNLAVIRQKIRPDNHPFDQQLINGLAAKGQLEAAAGIYNLVTEARQNAKTVSWQSDYPPFDWKLADSRELRAQADRDRSSLEFSIDPGSGGVLATRLIPTPDPPLVLRMDHQIEPMAQAKDLTLRLSCYGQTAAFYEKTFDPAKPSFAVGKPPACPYLKVEIAGRAWTGGRPLIGKLGPLEVMRQ